MTKKNADRQAFRQNKKVQDNLQTQPRRRGRPPKKNLPRQTVPRHTLRLDRSVEEDRRKTPANIGISTENSMCGRGVHT